MYPLEGSFSAGGISGAREEGLTAGMRSSSRTERQARHMSGEQDYWVHPLSGKAWQAVYTEKQVG